MLNQNSSQRKNLRWPLPAVSAAHQVASSNICSPNESSSLFVFFLLSRNNPSCPAASHQSALSVLLVFLSHRWGISAHPDLQSQRAHMTFFSPSPTKPCAPSPSCHSSLRTRVHILSVSQSFELHNTLLPCLIKHANMLNCGVKTWFASTPLCW